jgi:hypothetical protein
VKCKQSWASISTEYNLVFFTCYSNVQWVVSTGIQIPGLISSRRCIITRLQGRAMPFD